MQNRTLLLVYISAICSFFIFNSGCNSSGPQSSTFGSTALPTVGGPPPSVIPGSGNGILSDADYFYIGLDTTNDMIGHVHSLTGFKNPCGINKNSTSNEDIVCLFEIPEGELYAKDMKFQINVPPGDMCRYFIQEPYWFYNKEVGIGPKTISTDVTQNVNASGDITSTAFACAIDGVAGCTNAEVTPTLSASAQSYKCIYDDSAVGKPNCCTGNYKVTTTNIRVQGGSTDISIPVIKQNSWGGNLGECIGGPGKSWTYKTAEGIPVGSIEFSKNGVHTPYKILAPLNHSPPLAFSTSSINTANYYGDAISHFHRGFIKSADTSTAPYFIAPIDDRDGSYINATHSSYEYQCLDAGFEVKHRIRVFIRDWDTYPDFLNFVNSEGVTMVPDRGLDPEPGVNCAAIAAAGYACNDSYDIDDFLAINVKAEAGLASPVSYDMTNVVKRKFYFPRIQYK